MPTNILTYTTLPRKIGILTFFVVYFEKTLIKLLHTTYSSQLP